MPVRYAEAEWKGNGSDGRGVMRMAGGKFERPYSLGSRMQDNNGITPEDLIAAAHAGCFSMALAAQLELAGFKPQRVNTAARVQLENSNSGPAITGIQLSTQVEVPDIGLDRFKQEAEEAVRSCPVSKALTGTRVELEATLQRGPATA